MFAVFQINGDEDRDCRHDQDIQQILVGSNLGEPAGLGILIDDADVAGTLRDLPYDDKIRDQLGGDVVHHQGKQRFVCPPPRLEKGRDQGPYGTGRNAEYDHDHDQHGIRDLVSEQDHAAGRCQRTHEQLSLTADIPEPHPERRRQRQRDTEQNGQGLQQDPGFSGRAEAAVQDCRIHLDRVVPRHDRRDDGTDEQRKNNAECPDAPDFIPGHGFLPDHMEKRFMRLTVHRAVPLSLSYWSCAYRLHFCPWCGHPGCR